MSKKITEFNKQTLNQLRSEMQALFDKYEVKSNVNLHAGNISYSEAECTIKVTAKINGVMTREQKAIAMFSDYQYGDQITIPGFKGLVTLVAYKSRSPKYPFIVETEDGKRYKVTEASVNRDRRGSLTKVA